jgi:hypothetical protein
LGIQAVGIAEKTGHQNNTLAFYTEGAMVNNLHSMETAPGGRELEESKRRWQPRERRWRGDGSGRGI